MLAWVTNVLTSPNMNIVGVPIIANKGSLQCNAQFST